MNRSWNIIKFNIKLKYYFVFRTVWQIKLILIKYLIYKNRNIISIRAGFIFISMVHVDCGCDCNDCIKIHVSIIQSLSNPKFMTIAIFNCNCYNFCSICINFRCRITWKCDFRWYWLVFWSIATHESSNLAIIHIDICKFIFNKSLVHFFFLFVLCTRMFFVICIFLVQCCGCRFTICMCVVHRCFGFFLFCSCLGRCCTTFNFCSCCD